jgi:hypothetical protein
VLHDYNELPEITFEEERFILAQFWRFQAKIRQIYALGTPGGSGRELMAEQTAHLGARRQKVP